MPYIPDKEDPYTQPTEFLTAQSSNFDASRGQATDALTSVSLPTHPVQVENRQSEEPDGVRPGAFDEPGQPQESSESTKELSGPYIVSPTATAGGQQYSGSQRYAAQHYRTHSAMQMPPIAAISASSGDHFRNSSIASDYMYLQSPVGSPRDFREEFAGTDSGASNIHQSLQEEDNLDSNLDPALRVLSSSANSLSGSTSARYGYRSRRSQGQQTVSPTRESEMAKPSRTHHRHSSTSTSRSQSHSSSDRRGHSHRRSMHASPARSGSIAGIAGAGVSKPSGSYRRSNESQHQLDPRDMWKYGDPGSGGRPGPMLQGLDVSQHVDVDDSLPIPGPSSARSRQTKSRSGSSENLGSRNPATNRPYGLGIGAVEYPRNSPDPWQESLNPPALAPISHDQVPYQSSFQAQQRHPQTRINFGPQYQGTYRYRQGYGAYPSLPGPSQPQLLSRSSTDPSPNASDISGLGASKSTDRPQGSYRGIYDSAIPMPSTSHAVTTRSNPSYGYDFPGPGMGSFANEQRSFDPASESYEAYSGSAIAPANWLEFDRIAATAAAQQYAPREESSHSDDELMQVPGNNYDSGVETDWSMQDTEELLKLLDNGERYKWKYISDLLSVRQNKRIPIRACQNKFQAMFGESETGSALRSSLFYVAWRSGWDAIKNERTAQEREEGEHSRNKTVE